MVQIPIGNFSNREGIEYEDLSIKQSQEITICPNCGKGIHTKPLAYEYGKTKTNVRFRGRPTIAEREANTLGVICVCPVCKELIYATYIDYGHQDIDDEYTFKWEKSNVYPYKKEIVKFEETIESISPSFALIYNQAKSAEDMGLDEICGMGYRKALEFLIKDYAKKLHPDEVDTIERTFLKPCIENYISNEQIKRCAVGAAYLGNDESHYIRKWEDKDLSDLKKLIDMTVYWIVYSENTARFIQEMQLDR